MINEFDEREPCLLYDGHPGRHSFQFWPYPAVPPTTDTTSGTPTPHDP
jgi:hypothetical protein